LVEQKKLKSTSAAKEQKTKAKRRQTQDPVKVHQV
jgi:hypothetical protein